MATAFPHVWRGELLRNPGQPTARQIHKLDGQDSMDHASYYVDNLGNYDLGRCYKDLAEHWINHRYIYLSTIDAEPRNNDGGSCLEATIHFHKWDPTTSGGVEGYRVKIRVAGGYEICHLRAQGNHGWMECIHYRAVPQGLRWDNKEYSIYRFYRRQIDDNDEEEGYERYVQDMRNDRDHFHQYELRTSYTAGEFYTNIKLGKHEPVSVVEPPVEELNHWATIEDTCFYHAVSTPGNHIPNVMPQTHRLEVFADRDFRFCSWMRFGFFLEEGGLLSPMRWERDKHAQWDEGSARDPPKRFDLYSTLSQAEGKENEEKKIYLYAHATRRWSLVYLTPISIVNHVRKELAYFEETSRIRRNLPKPASGSSSRWFCVKSGFDNSLNPVYMFVKMNHNKNLLKSMVVKPVKRQPTEPRNDDQGRDTRPKEMSVSTYIQRMDGDRDLFTNNMFSSVRYPSGVETYYIYSQYASGGSLGKLLYDHTRRILVENRKLSVDQDSNFQPYLPEVFLWVVFERLVRACYMLRKHDVTQDRQQGFIHSDLKPMNILLRNTTGGRYETVRDLFGGPIPAGGNDRCNENRAYPIPMLADFEYCYRLGRDHIRNRRATPGYAAPEQYGPYPASPVLTDVFQIGCVMYGLMRCSSQGIIPKNSDGQIIEERFHEAPPPWRKPSPFIFDVSRSIQDLDSTRHGIGQYDEVYSHRLDRLVRHCLEEVERNRPSMEHLVREVREGLLQHDDLLGGVMEKAEDEVHAWFHIERPDEQFRRGQRVLQGKQRGRFGRKRKPEWDPYSSGEEDSFTFSGSSAEDI